MRDEYAFPVPAPTPVAIKTVPTTLFIAPIAVKLVDPTVAIMYELPVTKAPADTVFPCSYEILAASFAIGGCGADGILS